jgi:hypothetical protein
MKGDFTRMTFDPRKHYSSVRMQQGRVQIDSDWNEQEDIRSHRERTLARDAFGSCGGPVDNAGFGITYDGKIGDFIIGKGRYYVDGILCENEDDTAYSSQPDYRPDVAAVNLPEGLYLAYLDVWERGITAVEDSHIREVALGGPDTTTRIKTVWQVKIELLSALPDRLDDEDRDLREKNVWSRIGLDLPESYMAARIKGRSELENRLYRVEIHEGGLAGTATFKWSRDNGCIARAVEEIKGNTITISDPERNAVQILSPGRIVEVTEEMEELSGKSGIFATITSIRGLDITLDVQGDEELSRRFPEEKKPKIKIRLWDSKPLSAINKMAWARVDKIAGENEIRIRKSERDVPSRFGPGQVVEISDDILESAGRYIQARVTAIKEDAEGYNLILTNPTSHTGIEAKITEQSLPISNNPRVRQLGAEDEWVDIERGIQVAFEKGEHYYSAGDYWLIPSRALSGQIEWPNDDKGEPRFVRRSGIKHHYSKLASLRKDESGWRTSELRLLFPALPNTVIMSYIGGDGQAAPLDGELPVPFQVRVSAGELPIPGANIRFSIESGAAELFPPPGIPEGSFEQHGSDLIISTDEQGIAGCRCRMRSDDLQVRATLTRLLKESESMEKYGSSITFNAGFVTPARIPYLPLPGQSPSWFDGVVDVKDALDRLCVQEVASRVAYWPPEGVPFMEGTTTAQQGMDKLSLRLEDLLKKESWPITVGQGGAYGRLDEAVEDLMARGLTTIMLYLLPGSHELKSGLQLIKYLKAAPGMHLQISGSGRGSRIILPEGESMRLEGLSYLGLFDLHIQGRNVPEGVVSIKGIERFLMDNCQIDAAGRRGSVVTGSANTGSAGAAPSGTASIEATSMSTALSIREGEGEMIITNSRIEGVLCLYEGRPTEMEFSSYDMERLKKRVPLLTHRARRGVLEIRGNVIGRIAVGESMVQMIRKTLQAHGKPPDEMEEMFRMLFLTNNVISTGPNQLLATHLSLCSNCFGRVLEEVRGEGAGGKQEGSMGGGSPAASPNRSPENEWAVATEAVFIGNLGEDTKLSCVVDKLQDVGNIIELKKF